MFQNVNRTSDFPTWIQGNGWCETFSGQSTPGLPKQNNSNNHWRPQARFLKGRVLHKKKHQTLEKVSRNVSNVLLMAEILHQLRLVYQFIPVFTGFHISQVVQEEMGSKSWGTQMIQWTANEAMPGTRVFNSWAKTTQNNGCFRRLQSLLVRCIKLFRWIGFF